jgi:DNA polymerase III alpha subunit
MTTTTITQQIDNWGRVVLNEQGLLEMFYNGHFQTPDVLANSSDLVDTYNNWCRTFDAADKQINIAAPLQISPEEFHAERQHQWLMPDEYKTIDVEAWLLDRCATDVERIRVIEEMDLFKQHVMEDVLRFLIYMTSTLREEGAWWGVGRGSSVASYALYLIGVHKIDSIKYDLDIREFIRE